ncbi:MAG: universal stress protein [Candidatus Amulumruptor sp.]
MEDRLITIAIHTYEKALVLKSLLESEGIKVTLQNVNLLQPVVSSGVRVRIKESDLPLALRIIESSDSLCPGTGDTAVSASSDSDPVIIVPVDESPAPQAAISLAFKIAAAHNARIVLLHAYLIPPVGINNPLNDALTFSSEIAQNKETLDMETMAHTLMGHVSEDVRQRIKDGTLPPARFSTRVEEGVPEEVIRQTARELNPMLIVMGTRSSSQKQREMLGSVTAEVIDTCRYTVLTVPDDTAPTDPELTPSALFFGNMDQTDLLALDELNRLFGSSPLDVTIVNVTSKKSAKSSSESMTALIKYCSEHFTTFRCKPAEIRQSSVADDLTTLLREYRVDFISIPNKRRNAFTRIFNPSLAHRLLYDANLPMLVIPV